MLFGPAGLIDCSALLLLGKQRLSYPLLSVLDYFRDMLFIIIQ